jgi:hypothetical protein
MSRQGGHQLVSATGTSGLVRRWRSAAGGAVWLCYRAVWLALFAAGIATAAYIAPRDEIAFQSAYVAGSAFGFWVWTTDSLEGQIGAPLGDEGRRTGFRQGDLLLTVDGHKLPTDKAAEALMLAGPTGAVVELGLRRGNGERYTVRVARDPTRLRKALAGSGLNYAVKRWVQFAFDTTIRVGLGVAAALLFIRRPRDPIAQLLAFAIVLTMPDYQELFHIAPLADQAVEQTAYVLLITALLRFPDGRLSTRWHWLTILLFVVTSIYGLIGFLASTFDEASLIVSALPFVAMAIAVVTQYRRTPEGMLRQQAKFVLFGIVASCLVHLAATVLNAVATLNTSDMNVGTASWISLIANILFALAVLALPAGLFVSLFRYRLYDAESTISRSVVFGTLTLALLAIFAGSEKMIEILGEEYFGERLGALASGLGAGFAALMMVPLHKRVTLWAERRFQGNLVHLRKALPGLAVDMSATATPERLAEAVLARVDAGVRAAHGALVVGDELLAARDIDVDAVRVWLAAGGVPIGGEGQLRIDRDDPLFPLRVPLYSDSVGLAGWLLLGPRPDGSFYGKDERDTLLAIAEPVARAVAVTRHRQDSRNERSREIGGIISRVTALELQRAGPAPLAA